ncbi:MAG TPA: hypothetical protein VM658_09740 [bacterium]|nr:hypothetical protein [bacterium]
MREGKFSLFVLLAVLLAALAAGGAGEGQAQAGAKSPLDRFSAEQRQKLLAGEAVYEQVKTQDADGVTHGHGESYVIIAAPVAECWKIFTRFDEMQLYFPRKKLSEVIESSPGRAVVKKVFDFYVIEMQYTIDYKIDEQARRVDFQLDPKYPHDINDTAGFFLFEKIDEKRTLFSYAATKVDTGVKVPGFIQDYLTSRDLPAVAANVKKRIESGGKWTKD